MKQGWMSSTQNKETFNYDGLGHLKTHTRNIDGRCYTMTYSNYDALGRPLTITYPNGQTAVSPLPLISSSPPLETAVYHTNYSGTIYKCEDASRCKAVGYYGRRIGGSVLSVPT
jgi:YD repeat-containing protein